MGKKQKNFAIKIQKPVQNLSTSSFEWNLKLGVQNSNDEFKLFGILNILH